MGRKKKAGSHTIMDKLDQSSHVKQKEENARDFKEGSSPTAVNFTNEASINKQAQTQSLAQHKYDEEGEDVCEIDPQNEGDEIEADEHEKEVKKPAKSPSNSKPLRRSESVSKLDLDGTRSITRSRFQSLKQSISRSVDRTVNSMSWYSMAMIAVSLSLISLIAHLVAGSEAINVWITRLMNQSTNQSINRAISRGINLIALLAGAISVPITHGLVGKRKFNQTIDHASGRSHDRNHSSPQGSTSNYGDHPTNQLTDESSDQSTDRRPRSQSINQSDYHFFQPLEGGTRYIVLQIFGWGLYSLTLLGGLFLVGKLFFGWGDLFRHVFGPDSTFFGEGGLSKIFGGGWVISNLLVLGSLHFYASASNDAYRRSSDQPDNSSIKTKTSEKYSDQLNDVPRGIFRTKEDKKRLRQAKNQAAASTDQSRAQATDRDEPRVWAALSTNSGRAGLLITVISIVLALIIQSTNQSTGQSMYQLLVSSVILGVPLTHIMTGRKIHPQYSLFQPFEGGWAFVLLQALGWTLWTIAALISSFSIYQSIHGSDSGSSWLSFSRSNARSLHQHLISGAGIGAVISQALVLLSLKYFDARLTRRVARAGKDRQVERAYSSRNLLLNQSNDQSDESTDQSKSHGTKLRDEVKERFDHAKPFDLSIDQSVNQSINNMSTSQFETAINQSIKQMNNQATPTQKQTIGQSISQAINHSGQPMIDLRNQLAKNRRFTQSSRRLYDYASLINQSTSQLIEQSISQPVKQTVEPSSLISLSFSQWREGVSQLIDQLRSQSISKSIIQSVTDTFIVYVMYFVPIFGAMFAFSPFVMLYLWGDVSINQSGNNSKWVNYVVGLMIASYLATYRGRPGYTGKRSWTFIRNNVKLWGAFERYFSANVIAHGHITVPAGDTNSTKISNSGKNSAKHSGTAADVPGPYIFGFHPHGVYPLTTFWATRGPSFREAYPGLEVDVCGASVMFSCPLLREILLWSGGREVSASAIRHALHANRSILLVPGGQREMLHSQPSHRVLTIVTKHKGFVRIAIETGSSLVPILSLGETFPLSNIQLPRLQSWFLEKTGVGWPVFPYGRWYSPIGRPFPITVIIGDPIAVPKVEEPNQALIDEIHTKYYDSVRQLFEKYKAEAGFPNQTLVFSDV